MTEDFEFKPITEGLGFHKKIIDLQEDQSPTPVSDIMPRPKNLQKNIDPRKRPLQMPQNTPSPIPPKPKGWSPSIPEIDFAETASRSQELVPCATSWSAGFFDAAMVVGLTLIFSTAVFALTGIDLGGLLTMLSTEGGAQGATVVLLVAVFEIYSITCRTFFGKTLGEYAFGYRLGAPHEQQHLLYPLQVAWRTFLVSITGFILLPFLSEIIGRDIAGLLSGVSLYAEKK